MGEDFLKFKKKIIFQTLIKCLSVGFAAALFAAGVILLVCKLAAVEYAYLYMLSGLIFLPLTAGGMYLFLRPTDESVAKRLDRELSMQEKTRTMVAFRSEEGAIVSLQREDVQERLQAASGRKLRFYRLWLYLLASVLALALFVTAVCIPARSPEDQGKPDMPYEFDSYDRGLLEMLIREIREDEQLVQSPKDGYVARLEALLATMETVHYVSEKEQAVLTTVAAVYEVSVTVNTADELAAVLKASENAGVVQLSQMFSALDYSAITGNGVQSALDEISKTVDFTDNAVSDLETLHAQFGNLLAKANLDLSDPLTAAVTDLAGALYSARTAGDADTIRSQFDEAVKSETVTQALTVQAYTFNRAQYIETRLRAIFGMGGGNDGEKPGSQEKPDRPGEVTPPEEVTDGPGGIGSDKTDYGSNEMFFDPERGYVSYGEVIDSYYNYVQAMKEEGKVPEDLDAFIQKYFGILYGGIPEDGAEGAD